MVCEAVKPLEEMLKDWVAWMKSEGFKPAGQNGSYAYITSMFRLDGKSNSMHNFGLALDFQFFSKDFISPLTGTKQFKNEEQNVQNVKNAFDFKKNQSLKWLYNHAYEYGFVQPHWANDGNKVGNSDGEEWWHWEYHGTAAIYQLRNRPIPAVGNNSASDNPVNEIKESKIKSFVKNPKGKDGKNSVYTDMNYRQVNVSDKVTNKVGCPALPTGGSKVISSKDMYTELKKVTNLNDFAIAGIMGNLYQESRFKPQAFNSSGGGCGAYGMIQWRGDRLDKLDTLSKSLNSTIDDYKVQLAMVNDELTGQWTYTLNALKNVTNATDAAKIFSKTYEAGNKGTFNFNLSNVLATGEDNRTKFAREFYTMISTKNFT
jgi:hypothetical protein